MNTAIILSTLALAGPYGSMPMNVPGTSAQIEPKTICVATVKDGKTTDFRCGDVFVVNRDGR